MFRIRKRNAWVGQGKRSMVRLDLVKAKSYHRNDDYEDPVQDIGKY